MVPTELRYTKEHEWIRVEDGVATVGITANAADQLGDIVFVELPDGGKDLVGGKTFGVIESVKAVSDLYAPVSGTVVETNDALAQSPELVNTDPYGAGWMLKMTIADESELAGLLDAAAYEASVAAG